MAKVLVVDYDKCTGCRTCEMACSLAHEDIVNPSQSRIQVSKWDIERVAFKSWLFFSPVRA